MNDYWIAAFICDNFILRIVFKIKIWIFFKIKHQRRSRIDSQQKISTRTMISWTLRNYLSLAIKVGLQYLGLGGHFVVEDHRCSAGRPARERVLLLL